jgi:hypothetical protein
MRNRVTRLRFSPHTHHAQSRCYSQLHVTMHDGTNISYYAHFQSHSPCSKPLL